MISPKPSFMDTPLITPERLEASPEEAFAFLPPWVRAIELVSPLEYHDAALQPVVIIWAGKGRIQYEAHSPLAAAIMFEVTRIPGVSIAVNSNGTLSNYFRFSIGDVGEDLTTVSRFLTNAGADEQVLKTPGRKWDMRTETLRKTTAGKPSKDSRAVLMGHIERLAQEWEASGKMPSHLTAVSYLANLNRLIRLLDLESTGKDLSDLLRNETEA